MKDRMTRDTSTVELLSATLQQMGKLGDAAKDVLDQWDKEGGSLEGDDYKLDHYIELLRKVLGPDYRKGRVSL